MGDIVDLDSLAESTVKTIDFRVFATLWCGLNMDHTCSGSLCCALSVDSPLSGNFNDCRSLLSGLHGNIDRCVYAVEEDCRTTVWTYQHNDDGMLDSFQPDIELQKKKKISYIRKRRDVYQALGPGSKADAAPILSFGSLFSAPYKGSELYIDIHDSPGDSYLQSLLEKIESIPFVPELIAAGKEFAVSRIKEPFLCAQLRLLDGQFKNHWKTTFSTLEQKLQSLRLEFTGKKTSSPINIFIMTDLGIGNWTGTYLADLAKYSDSYRIIALEENDELIIQAAKELMEAEHGLRSGFLPRNHGAVKRKKVCEPLVLPDILLYVEEVICSCASLGFVGTAGSTIEESITLMRKNSVCKL